MAAFGWSYVALAATHSELTKSIQPHKDLQKLARGIEHLTIAIPFLGGPSASEDEIQEKKRCSDSDNADRPVKQVRLSQSIEEPDISMMTELSRMPGELEMSMMMGLSPTPEQPDMSMMMRLSPTPGQLDMSMMMRLSPTPGQLDMSMMMGLSTMPGYSQEIENWADETHGWK
jgi:hypothetical protein